VPVKVEEPTPAKTPVKATTTRNPPKSHSLVQGGVKHAAGSDNPMQKCAVCHGKDLRGGKVANVSCYECHDKVWK
jgi:hypothetical protein